MSYSFNGDFEVTPPLSPQHIAQLDLFAAKRHDEPEYPGVWCQWVPNEDGTAIEWDGEEKFYEFEGWLVYLIDTFLKPWGHTLNGTVDFDGDDGDHGRLVVKDNELSSSAPVYREDDTLREDLRAILKEHVGNETSAADLAEAIYELAHKHGVYEVE